jgi:ATP-binding cassette, subfamily B, bacterial
VRVAQSMVYDLANDLFASLQRRSLVFHSRNSVGDAMTRITGDSWCVHSVVDTLLFGPGHALLTIIGMVALMWSMDVNLTLLSLAVAPAMVFASVLLGKPIRSAARSQREVESQLHSHVQQTLSGMPIVQAFAQEERSTRRFEEFAGASLRAQQTGVLIGSVSGLSSGLITTFGSALVLWLGARRVLDGQLTVGSLLVFIAYLNSLQFQLKAFTGIYGTLQGLGARVERVMEVLEAEPEVGDRPGAAALPPVRGHVRLEKVSFGYERDRPVLKEVSLEAQPGEMVALVGVTGAGKSTLMSLIPRFYDPWSGRVLIDGVDVREAKLKSVRSQVGLVLQEPFLFPMSVAENIAYGRPEAKREEVVAAAKVANAHEFIERLPEGYETVLGERGATLSGGQRQRLSIARALLKDAPILILDEPTSALDAETEAMLLEALGRLMAGRTTFIIAHRLSTIRNADKIAVLQEGEVVEIGSHQELLARNGVYARVHTLQFAAPPPAEARPLVPSTP